MSRPVYDVHVPPSLTSLSVPDEFLQPGTVYELEVIALEESGNQTFSLGFFLEALRLAPGPARTELSQAEVARHRQPG